MKKTYINPEMVVVEIKGQHLLAGSPKPTFNPNETSGTMNSRDFDIEFDEEEDY